MRVRITQLDGSLPNLALMALAHHHRARGDEVVFTRQAHRDLLEGDYGAVYGSAIFKFSAAKIARFLADWPGAIIGGTGTEHQHTVEDIIGGPVTGHDYSLYPLFTPSLGFTQRGCRLSCKFCVVPGKEGANRSAATVADIWRGEGHPKRLHLLDNDFFGQAEWRERIAEIREGGFKVCWNQGINVRAMTPEVAAAIASVQYRDDAFKERRLYTAWDNLKDEGVFFRGIDMLEAAGVPGAHVMAFMLCGFAKGETPERLHHRFNAMVTRGVRPYPMVYDCRATDPVRYRRLKQFQRWAVTGLYRAVPFADYDAGRKARHGAETLQMEFAA